MNSRDIFLFGAAGIATSIFVHKVALPYLFPTHYGKQEPEEEQKKRDKRNEEKKQDERNDEKSEGILSNTDEDILLCGLPGIATSLLMRNVVLPY